MLSLVTFGTVDVAFDDVRDAEPLLRQRKRLALLVYLLTRRPIGSRPREELTALFWPELSAARASNALSKALHFLKKCIGTDAFILVGRSAVGVAPDRFRCDAWDLQAALDRGDGLGALELYRGPFLQGLRATGAPDFDRWVESEQQRYRAAVVQAGAGAVEHALEMNRLTVAALAAERLERLAPTEAATVRSAMRVALRSGKRAAAIRRLETYEAWLKEEFGEGAPADLVRLLGPLRHAPVGSAGTHAEWHAPDIADDALEASRRALSVDTLEDYRAFVDLLPDMVYRCDIRGSFPFVNAEVLRQSGWSAEELRETSFEALVREDFRHRVVDFYIRQLEDRIPVTYLEFPTFRKDGSEYWVGQKVRLLEKDGVPIGVQVVARDITARIRREASQRRMSFEDRRTRVLNRDALVLLAGQVIRACRRSRQTFFTLHISLPEMPDEAPDHVDTRVRFVHQHLRSAVREDDIIGRVGGRELLLISGGGDRAAAEAVARRLLEALAGVPQDGEASLEAPSATPEIEITVHDPTMVRTGEAVLPAARIVPWD